jgi:hypothetical protein
MMKNNTLLLLTFSFLLLLIVACKKDSEEEIKKDNTKEEPNGGCDTSFVPGFASRVKPIFDRYCIGCHSSSGPSGGIALSSNAQSQANAAKIIASINHDPSLSLSKRMPPAGGKLDSCDIKIIERWANQGFPE